MPTSDHVRLVEVHQVGLEAAVERTWGRLKEVYASTSSGHREEIDAFVDTTGMIPMLQAANRLVGDDGLNPSALRDAGGLFHKPKTAISQIPGWIPLVGWLPGALGLIDDI